MSKGTGYTPDMFEDLFSDEYSIGKKKKKIKKEKDKKTLDSKIARLALLITVIATILIVPFFLKPSIVGFVTVTQTVNYEDVVDLEISSSQNYTWFPSNLGELQSLKLKGTAIRNGSAKVYLLINETRYLILDSDILLEDPSNLITGAVVVNETGTNETQSNESSEGGEIGSDETIIVNLEYKLGTSWDSDDDGRESVDKAIDFSVENSEFSWDANESNLCSRWMTFSVDEGTSTTVCYGGESCCNFFDLSASSENWDDIYYSYYGRYGATLNNIISAQLAYVDYSLDPENPYSNIFYSSWDNRTAEFYYEILSFDDICVETCLLEGLNESMYILEFEVEDATVAIESIKYSIKEERTNSAPEFSLIPNLTIEQGESKLLDLSDYVSDEDNDDLYYSYYPIDNITIDIIGSIANITPDDSYLGRRFTFFSVNDSIATDVSNVLTIEVIEKGPEVNLTEEKIQIFAEINKPVKWRKRVKLNASVVNVTVDITEDASNISVKKVEEDIETEIIETNVKVIDREEVKELEEYNLEKEIENLQERMIKATDYGEISELNIELNRKTQKYNQITGGVIVESEGKGLLTRFFEWLFEPAVTGLVVVGPEEFVDAVMNITVNQTVVEDNEILIEENVSEVVIEYETDAPIAYERNVSNKITQLIIESSIEYINVLSYVDIRDVPSEAVRLYWYVNESEFYDYNNVSYNSSLALSSIRNYRLDITNKPGFFVSLIDKNNNTFIDKVQWVAPHLSNQTFEVEINVLNVQSYPMVGDNWTVAFTTIGSANLTINTLNDTSFTEFYYDNTTTADDLEILNLRCNETTLFDKPSRYYANNTYFVFEDTSRVKPEELGNYSIEIESLFITDYLCNETSFYTVRVLTPGVHNQFFIFGNDTAYANNYANYPPITDIIAFSDGNLSRTVTFFSD